VITKKNNKRYFKTSQGDAVSKPMERAYLLRYHDEESSSIQNEGPFSSEKDALRVLSTYLKDGICSWIVAYNE
jgi:hypothetical protein